MTALIKYDAACRALSEARTIDEVKDIRDKAEAMRVYAHQAKNRTMELDAQEIRWRAERRLGEMIRAQKETVGLNRGAEGVGTSAVPEENRTLRPTLADSGIDKKLSSRSQRYASLDEDSFERLVAQCRALAEDEAERAPLDLFHAEQKDAARAAATVDYEARTADGCTASDLDALAAGGARFPVIYADPPWEFRVYSGKGKDRSADRHYDTGGLESIKALPVAALAADDCALLMWCVMPELPGALDVIRAWGFEYKTVGFTWVKQNKSGEGLFWGMGYWTRANAELCLLATKGSPERVAKDVHQVILSPIGEHSQKPDGAHERIERLLRGPYLELYARRSRRGWTTWGNEIPRADITGAHSDAHNPEPDSGIIEAAEEIIADSITAAAEFTALRALETIEAGRDIDIKAPIVATLKAAKLARGSVKLKLTKLGMTRLEALRKEEYSKFDDAPPPDRGDDDQVEENSIPQVDCRVCSEGTGLCAGCLPAGDHVTSIDDEAWLATCSCGWLMDAFDGELNAAIKAHLQNVVTEAKAASASVAQSDPLDIPACLRRAPAEAAE